MLANVAVDAVFDSVSVATTYKKKLLEAGVIFCSFTEAVELYPDKVKKYLGSVVPVNDNYYAALNSAVFSDGSFVFIPKGVRCPMELSTYFRINTQESGQFERTLIVAEEGGYVAYNEGCTAPQFDTNQLHAAVVELVALDDAEIKYSTVQNWYAGDENGKGGIYNFVTKRGACRGVNSKISWTQVETGSAITWKYPSVILQGDNSIGEFYSVALTNNAQIADTGTKMIHLGKNTKSTIISKGISAGKSNNSYRGLVKIMPKAAGARNYTQCDSMLIGGKVGSEHISVHRGNEQHRPRRARGDDLKDQRGPVVLSAAARHLAGGCRVVDHQWILQGSVSRTADGIRGRGDEAVGIEAGRKCWIINCSPTGSGRAVMSFVAVGDRRVEINEMDGVQVSMAPAGVEFDAVLHGQLLDRRERLQNARSQNVFDMDVSRLLSEVDAALMRFEKGTYGLCEECHTPIESDRLLADPLMRVCLEDLSEKQRHALEDDLQLASSIQNALLPKTDLGSKLWEFDFHYQPAGIVSGDYCDVIADDGELYFVLGDVSGKGMAASLLMSNLHAMFHSLVPLGLPLHELMGRANHMFCESTLSNQYATLVFGKINASGEAEV